MQRQRPKRRPLSSLGAGSKRGADLDLVSAIQRLPIVTQSPLRAKSSVSLGSLFQIVDGIKSVSTRSPVEG